LGLKECDHARREEVIEMLRHIAMRLESGDFDSLNVSMGKEVTEFSTGDGKPVYRYPTGREMLKLTWTDINHRFGAEA
jgi:hypothetical protein